MTNSIFALFVLLPTIAHCQLLTSSVQVFGHVFSRAGTPVSDARVVFWSYSGGGTLQPATTTSADGSFSLTISNVSAGAVSASKANEGHPDAALAFYGQTGYRSLQVIDPRKDSTSITLDLYFGAPQRTLSWTVVDSRTGEPVIGARAYVEAANNAAITGSETIREGEPFVFVVPFTPIRIRISAGGYLSQSSVEQDQGVASAHEAHFELDKRTIRLQPIN